MKLRYMWTIVISLPTFVLLGLWGMASLPIVYIVAVLCVSSAIGYVCAAHVFEAIRRAIVDKETSWITRRAPGGIWFFIVVGSLVGVIASLLLRTTSSQFSLRLLALGAGTILTVLFVLVAIQVRRLERSEGKQVLMSHDGLFLE